MPDASATEDTTTTLEIRSTVTAAGTLELTLAEAEVGAPGEDEVVLRMEASPLNPSDLGLLFGMADMTTARVSGTATRPTEHRDSSSSPVTRR